MIIIITSIIAALVIGTILFLHQPSFGRLPQGERLERIKQSPNYRNGEFRNQSPTELMTGKGSRWQTLFGFLLGNKMNIHPDTPVATIKTDLQNLPKDKDLMIWFGHSSYLLQISGKRILVDPVFYAASPVSWLYKPFKGTDIYKPEDMPEIDYLIVSHDHYDHLEYRTVVALKERVGKVICPLGVGEHFECWGYDKKQLVELDWKENVTPSNGFTVHCLPTRHFSGRSLKANQTLWASFLIDTPSLKVYIGGDGGYDRHFKEIGKQYPNIDLAILENGQYNEDWKYIHTMPVQLAQVAKDLKAKNIITVHHSKHALARHRWDEPLQNELTIIQDDRFNLLTPIIGEVTLIKTNK